MGAAEISVKVGEAQILSRWVSLQMSLILGTSRKPIENAL